MDGGIHQWSHKHYPYQHIGLQCFKCKCWVSCWNSQLLIEKMEDLRHVLMVRVLHTHTSLCASRVRFQRIWTLSFSCRLTWEYPTPDLEAACQLFPDAISLLFRSSAFSRLDGYPKYWKFFLHGLRNTKLTGLAFAGIVGLGLKSPLDLFLTWRSAFRSDRQKENHWNGSPRKPQRRTNEESDSFRHAKLPLVRKSAIWLLVSTYVIWILVFHIDPVKEPIKSDSLGSWHVSDLWNSSFNYHIDHGFVVFKDVQLRLTLRRMCKKVRNPHETLEQPFTFFCQLWSWLRNWVSRTSFPDAFLFGLNSVGGWTQYFNHFQEQITHSYAIGIQKNNLRLCRTARDRSLFLAHTADENNCSTSKKHKTPPEVDFESFFKISSKVWVLEQTQSTMLSNVAHMTILTIVICAMNVWNQRCLSSVTCLSPFCDWPCKLVDRPQNVRSCDSCKVQAFQEILWAYL